MTEDNKTRNIAMFCDFENIALGVRDAKYDRFDLKAVLGRRSEEHTSELQSLVNLVCRLLLEKKKHN